MQTSVLHELNQVLNVDQDSVRLLAVESCSAFASSLSRDDAAAQLLPVILKFAQVREVDFRPDAIAYLVADSCRTSLGG